MKTFDLNRRDFIAGLGGLVVHAGWKDQPAGAPVTEPVFVGPIDGDILHTGDGPLNGGRLMIGVKIAAPPRRKISVNQVVAEYKDGYYTAVVPLSGYRNELTAKDHRSNKTKKITVFLAPRLKDKYRLSIDDAIWFLRDIQANAHEYTSIFDTPFLGFLRYLHQTYGTKTHINLFYETDHFDLSRMTDKFKSEWRENAEWLRLSFHAWSEFPDNPYLHASYEKVRHDCEGVMNQIRRFAGEEVMGPVTTLHWGEVPVEVSRALRDCGYTGQLCDFNVDNNLPPTSYYLTVEQRRHMNRRFVWRDNREDISFIKSSVILDTVKADRIVPFLDQYEKESRKPPYCDLLIHEQYFYPFYKGYQPDYRQKVLTSVEWAVKNGYSPAFLDECLFG